MCVKSEHVDVVTGDGKECTSENEGHYENGERYE